MESAEIFYTIGSIVLAILGVVSLLIAYALFRIYRFIQNIPNPLNLFALGKMTKYSLQFGVLKYITNLLTSKGGDKHAKTS